MELVEPPVWEGQLPFSALFAFADSGGGELADFGCDLIPLEFAVDIGGALFGHQFSQQLIFLNRAIGYLLGPGLALTHQM